MKKLSTARVAGAAVLSLLIFAAPAKAVLLSGFESGFAADGWSTIGSTSIVDGTFGSGPTQGAFQAFLSTGTGAASEPAIEAFLGIPTGDLDTISPSGGTITEGSVISLDFSGSVGDVLSFDWNFLTDETGEGGVPAVNDVGVAAIFDPFILAISLDTVGMPSATPFFSETGFGTFSYVLTTTGSFTLQIGVFDDADSAVDSGLLVDNVTLSDAIPEPAAATLLVLGLSGLGLARRRAG